MLVTPGISFASSQERFSKTGCRFFSEVASPVALFFSRASVVKVLRAQKIAIGQLRDQLCLRPGQNQQST